MIALSCVAFIVIAIALGALLSYELKRWQQRRHARRGNGKILVLGNADHPAFIATSVVVRYESVTINSIAGHRFTILRWLDDRRLGGSWVPGPLSAAQREVIELCAREAWTQSRAVRS